MPDMSELGVLEPGVECARANRVNRANKSNKGARHHKGKYPPLSRRQGGQGRT